MTKVLVFVAGVLCGAGLAATLAVVTLGGSAPEAAPAVVLPPPPRPNSSTELRRVPLADAEVAAAAKLLPPSPPVPVPAALPPPLASDGAGALPAAASLPGALMIPVEGVGRGQLVDSYSDLRDGVRPHEALDIPAPRGTAVLAVADGRIVKLFTSVPGGLTLYESDPGETLVYYYAHLDRYAPGIMAGQQVKQGDVIGYVGSSGNASPMAPHLHFAIFRLGPEKRWWQGTPINPYPWLGGR